MLFKIRLIFNQPS